MPEIALACRAINNHLASIGMALPHEQSPEAKRIRDERRIKPFTELSDRNNLVFESVKELVKSSRGLSYQGQIITYSAA